MNSIAHSIAHQVGTHLGSKLNQNEPEVRAYITGLTTPLSSGQIDKLNTFVAALKSGLSISALSDAFDVIRVYAGETSESAVRNLVQNAFHATLVNSPAFTQFEGFTGNGTSSYIDENWNGRDNADNYLLDSAAYGLYLRIFERGSQKLNGAYSTIADGGLSNRLAFGSNTESNLFVALNSSSDPFINDINENGCYILSRNNSSDIDVYRNKIKTTVNRSSSKIPNQGIVTLARRSTDASISLFNTSQISFMFLSKGLSAADVGIITDAFEAYMDSNGKGVIA